MQLMSGPKWLIVFTWLHICRRWDLNLKMRSIFFFSTHEYQFGNWYTSEIVGRYLDAVTVSGHTCGLCQCLLHTQAVADGLWEVGASSFMVARYWTIMPGPLSSYWECLGSTSVGESCRPVDVQSIHDKINGEEQKWQFNGDHLVDSDTLVTSLKTHS